MIEKQNPDWGEWTIRKNGTAEGYCIVTVPFSIEVFNYLLKDNPLPYPLQDPIKENPDSIEITMNVEIADNERSTAITKVADWLIKLLADYQNKQQEIKTKLMEDSLTDIKNSVEKLNDTLTAQFRNIAVILDMLIERLVVHKTLKYNNDEDFKLIDKVKKDYQNIRKPSPPIEISELIKPDINNKHLCNKNKAGALWQLLVILALFFIIGFASRLLFPRYVEIELPGHEILVPFDSLSYKKALFEEWEDKYWKKPKPDTIHDIRWLPPQIFIDSVSKYVKILYIDYDGTSRILVYSFQRMDSWFVTESIPSVSPEFKMRPKDGYVELTYKEWKPEKPKRKPYFSAISEVAAGLVWAPEDLLSGDSAKQIISKAVLCGEINGEIVHKSKFGIKGAVTFKNHKNPVEIKALLVKRF